MGTMSPPFRRSIFLFKQFPFGALTITVALVAGLFSVVRAFQATQELARTREREAQVATVYAEIRQLRHEFLLIEASPKDLLIELDRTEEQLQNGHLSLEQTRTKLQSLRNELAESQQRSERLRLPHMVIETEARTPFVGAFG